MSRAKLLAGCLSAAILCLSLEARAKHPVKEIPLRAYVLGDTTGGALNFTPVDMQAIARMVELANRVYAAAGIKFTFDPYNGWEQIEDADMNCFDGREPDASDPYAYSWLGSGFPEGIVLMFHSYHSNWMAECVPVAGCVPLPVDTCPEAASGQQTCTAYPWGSYCGPAGHFSGGPACFWGNCRPATCQVEGGLTPTVVSGSINQGYGGIHKFAHEFGHTLGVAHTFDAPSYRCYDTGYQDAPNCNPPASCVGPGQLPPPGGSCGSSSTPWKNIMSYHDDCPRKYAGSYHGYPSDWNTSLSRDQIQIIWRALDEYWDPPLTGNYWRNHSAGGYDPMYIAQDPFHGTSLALGFDDWDYVAVYQQGYGELAWTKGNVRIVQGDFDADGSLDVIVSAQAGSHPGTTYWKGPRMGSPFFYPPSASLVYVSTLDAGAFPGNSRVHVGNFSGDEADDVLVQTAAGTAVYKGRKDVAGWADPWLPAWQIPGWTLASTSLVTGDFHGDWSLPNPITKTWISDYFVWDNLSFDDVVVFWGQYGAYLYQGSASGLAWTGKSSPSYPVNTQAWAANVWGDRHDELIVRGPNGLTVLKGQDSFDFNAVLWQNFYVNQGATVDLVIGNFARDHHADVRV
jgi:hypothetical protein